MEISGVCGWCECSLFCGELDQVLHKLEISELEGGDVETVWMGNCERAGHGAERWFSWSRSMLWVKKGFSATVGASGRGWTESMNTICQVGGLNRTFECEMGKKNKK